MTRLLCLEDGYLKGCGSRVVAVDGQAVELDQTVFYPRGGGQPSDTGTIKTVSGPVFRVLEALKKDGRVLHMVEGDASSLKAGDEVACSIDWERRYALMRMHTAAHVLAGTMHSKMGARITGNQLDVDKTRFDFDLEDFDRARFDALVSEANEALSQDVALKVYSLPREEAMKLPGVVKLAGALPPSVTELRIVEIPGIDFQADGGTHVANLKEVGAIDVIKLENKGKSNRRIYFTLRGR